MQKGSTSRTPFLFTEWTDPITQAKGWLVLDQLKGGIGDGGTRMKPGLSLLELQRIARTMSRKLNVAGMQAGGAKGGVDYDPAKPDATAVLQRFYEAHKPFLENAWITGEDLGTREEDIVRIMKKIGLRTPIEAMTKTTRGRRRIHAHRKAMVMKHEGHFINQIITGFGCVSALKTTLKYRPNRSGLLLDPLTTEVSIQGFGSVGSSAALYLGRQGFILRAVSDAAGTVYTERPEGLDAHLLWRARDERKRCLNRKRLPGCYRAAPRDEWLGFDVDVLLPAAIADVITEKNARKLSPRVSYILEGANIPTTAGAEAMLSRKGVTIIPDFIANSGMVCLDAATLTFEIPLNARSMLTFVDQTISRAIRRCSTLMERKSLTMREAALELFQ